jgi:predicted DCC family thiol-disulfide oxidoreductase YuxK
MTRPILLYNDECGVCRRIARWVGRSARSESGEASIVEQPIGDDPEALRLISPDLDIWDAYATIHLVMPDGSMKLGGEAVAEVLRSLENTRWFAGIFAVSLFGFRPFQLMLNMAYAILASIRPLLGCESCGTPSVWMRPLVWTIKRARTMFGGRSHPSAPPHFTSRPIAGRRLPPARQGPSKAGTGAPRQSP